MPLKESLLPRALCRYAAISDHQKIKFSLSGNYALILRSLKELGLGHVKLNTMLSVQSILLLTRGNCVPTDFGTAVESAVNVTSENLPITLQLFNIWEFRLFLYEIKESIFKMASSKWRNISVVWQIKNTGKSSVREKFV